MSALLRSGDDVLVVREPGSHGRWTLPTTELRHGAAPQDAVRAVLREVGLAVTVNEAVAVTSRVIQARRAGAR